MKNPARAGADPLPIVLAALLLAATVTGGVAAFAIGFATAGSAAVVAAPSWADALPPL